MKKLVNWGVGKLVDLAIYLGPVGFSFVCIAIAIVLLLTVLIMLLQF